MNNVNITENKDGSIRISVSLLDDDMRIVTDEPEAVIVHMPERKADEQIQLQPSSQKY